MKLRGLAVIGLFALCPASWANAQNPPNIAEGHAVFEHTCAPCHGAGPGNDGLKARSAVIAIEIKYKGEKPGLIEHRTDLPYPVLKAFVRFGAAAMAPFRPTEVTDQQIADIAAYLQSTAQQWVAQGKPTDK
jgi:mono/diheme cytochrome c family protein